jgi:hypothetical protein
LRLADCGQPGIGTDPHLLKFVAGALNLPQDKERHVTRPQWCVFECDRGIEDRHDTVAGKTQDDAACLHTASSISSDRLRIDILAASSPARSVKKHRDFPTAPLPRAFRTVSSIMHAKKRLFGNSSI